MKNRINIKFCTYFKDLEKFRYEHETYDHYTAFCLESGSLAYGIDSLPDRILSSGEIVICPPGKSFFRKIISTCRLCMIKFEPEGEAPHACSVIKVCDRTRYEYDLSMLSDCLFCSDMENYPEYEHFCRDILYLALREEPGKDVFSRVLRELSDNYSANADVRAMAARSGYSQAHFINRFKGYCGMTPKQYALQIRLKKAKELLLTTDRSSKEIAFICGFSDELYFLRFFKKRTGLTTSEFRKNTV